MADYINGNILCQAYVKIDAPFESIDDIDAVKRELTEFVRSRGEFYLYESVEVRTEVREGSIIQLLSLGGAITLCTALAKYPSIRAGAIALYGDVKRLADSFASEAIFRSKARRTDVVRIEARTGVIGSFKSLVDRLDRLDQVGSKTPLERISTFLDAAAKRASMLFASLEAEEDKAMVAAECRLTLARLKAAVGPIDELIGRQAEVFQYRLSLNAFERLLDPFPKQTELFQNNPPQFTRGGHGPNGAIKLFSSDEDEVVHNPEGG